MIFKQVFDQKSSTYTYIIASAEGREALIIDPVLENVEDYIKLLTELNLKLVKVIDTHIHADHVTGAGKLRDKTQCVTIMGEHTPTDAVEIKVKDEEIIKLDQLKIKALYTPGHTSDSFSFLMDNYLFSGDTFNGLEIRTLNLESLNLAQHKLRILSGLYGILRPLDGMQPYRLEMGTKIVIEMGMKMEMKCK